MPTTPASTTPAPLWRRLVALAYDLLPLCGLWLLGAGLWLLALRGHYDPQHPAWLPRALLDIWLLLLTAAYFVISWTRVGATIGMRAWKLKLVQTNGALPDWRIASRRFALAVLSAALLGGGYWYALFNPERRTWHDRVCGTHVMRYK